MKFCPLANSGDSNEWQGGVNQGDVLISFGGCASTRAPPPPNQGAARIKSEARAKGLTGGQHKHAGIKP